ncbi:MAG: ABC transporter permease [Peptococcaceae bacterium]|nr:ABC transporter permease [Peptococcaceae bacterium]
MFWRILKKDLKRKKTMNLVFLAFMILCTLFLSSSAANIAATYNMLNYFLDVSRIPDQYYLASSDFEEEFDAWLASCPYAESYEKSVYVLPNKEDIMFNGEELQQNLAFLFFATPDCDYLLMFNENDKGVTSVTPGEMAMSANMAKNLGLKKGDILDIRSGSGMKSFRLTTLAKDAFFGKENMGVTRIFLSHQDYTDLLGNTPNKMLAWSVTASDSEKLHMDYSNQNIPVDLEVTRDSLSTLFTAEKISPSSLIIVAIAMMIIALVLLQFAIRFTIEEDFREIGVIKAIGIKNSDVRWMYIIKYLAISAVGAAIGLALSQPFGDFLIAPLKENMVMPESAFGLGKAHFYLGKVPVGLDMRPLCALGVVGLTLLSSWRVTRPIATMSAIQAIREGASGERFRPKGIIKLRGSQIKAVLFLAVNDILSGLRSFVPVFLALSLSMLMIILPANIASTLRSGESIKFGEVSKTDAYSNSLVGIRLAGIQGKTYPELKSALIDIEQEFFDKGILIEASAGIMISSRIYKDNQFSGATVLGYKHISENPEKPIDVTYFAGIAPKLANEIAITDVLMQKLDVLLGDTVLLDFGPEKKRYIITGQIQSIHYNGHKIIFSPLDEPDLLYAVHLPMVLIDFIDRNDIPGQIDTAREMFPQYNILTAEEIMRNQFGGDIDTLHSLVIFLFFVSLIIVCLVVFLVSHALLDKDKLAIVFLKSIGFTNGAIRSWQILRTMIVSTVGILLGIGLSFILNPLVTKLSFGAAGADKFTPQYDVLWTFIMYPALILMGILVTTIFASLGIGKISIRNTGRPESCPPSPNSSSVTARAAAKAPTSAATMNQKKGT